MSTEYHPESRLPWDYFWRNLPPEYAEEELLTATTGCRYVTHKGHGRLVVHADLGLDRVDCFVRFGNNDAEPMLKTLGRHFHVAIAEYAPLRGQVIYDPAEEDIAATLRALREQNKQLLAVLRYALEVVPVNSVVYSEGDHGDRVYVFAAIKAAIRDNKTDG